MRIGCSGWQYASWRGRFYPRELAMARWLEFYAQAFDTVEVNNSFYRLPEKKTFANWAHRTPDGFLFAVKASRYLTHLKRLLTPGPPLRRLFSRVKGLGPKLGPVLYQLPGQMMKDVPRLAYMIKRLPRRADVRHVIEFRHPSWYSADVFALLEASRVTLCLHDRTGSPIREPIVGPFMYVRFHGASGSYHGGYGRTMLDRWAAVLVEQARAGREVFAYFNNDPDAQATRDAIMLRTLVQRRLART
jgi:uncharacterized protein YecE (DUF72 family)